MTIARLTKSVTKPQAAEVALRQDDLYVSANQTCEIGMSRATGKQYRHIAEVLEELSRQLMHNLKGEWKPRRADLIRVKRS